MSESTSLRDRSPILRWLRGVPRPVSARRASRDSIIASSGLPAPIADLVRAIVRRVGGTRHERRDVASELVAHFQDALTHVGSPDEALRAFGDPRTAAKLLRRAVRRKRGFVWKSWWWASRGIAATVLLATVAYGWLAAEFWLRKPNVAVDYLAQLQGLFPNVTDDEAAWPAYRAALHELRAGATPAEHYRQFRSNDDHTDGEALDAIEPGTNEWSRAEAFLRERSKGMELLRAATRRPALGLLPGALTADDFAFFGLDPVPVPQPADSWDGSLTFVLLPHLAELRGAARWLLADARHAIARGESTVATDDVIGALRVASHTREPIVISQLVANAVTAMAAEALIDLLERHGDRFSNEDLTRLAHALDESSSHGYAIDFAGEGLMWRDIVQRIYSDDGDGDGQLLATSYGLASAFSSRFERSEHEALGAMLAPVTTRGAPTRAEANRMHDDHIGRLKRREATPFAHRGPASELGPDPLDLHAGILAPLLPLAEVRKSSSSSLPDSAEQTRARVDAARMAVAAERYRRAHRTWPSALDALVPDFLPALPRDLWASCPFRYRTEDGAATLWSVGPDLDDDGGREPEQEAVDLWSSRAASDQRTTPSDGDLVLWRLSR